MEIKYNDDKTKELKEKGILKEKKVVPKQKMIKKTPYVMDEATYYHSFVKS
jgi:hypothetical protein